MHLHLVHPGRRQPALEFGSGTLHHAGELERFPLDLNGSHAACYIFTLRTEDSDSSNSKFVTLNYVEEHTPIVDSFTYDLTADSEHAFIYWEATGADEVNITYLKYGTGNTEIVFTQDQGLDPDMRGVDIPIRLPLFTEQGAGYYIVNVEFANQYGTTTKTFVVSVSDPNVEPPPPGGGTDGPPL
jgi:hypothetical protein